MDYRSSSLLTGAKYGRIQMKLFLLIEHHYDISTNKDEPVYCGIFIRRKDAEAKLEELSSRGFWTTGMSYEVIPVPASEKLEEFVDMGWEEGCGDCWDDWATALDPSREK